MTGWPENPIAGEWWLPGNRQQSVRGLLRTRSRFVQLELLGSIGNLIQSLEDPSAGGPSVIHGETRSGKPVTLAACTLSGVSFGGSFSTETYVARFVLFGGHYSPFSDAKFHHLTVGLSGLQNWINLVEYSFDRDHFSSVGLEQRDPVEFTIGESTSIELAPASSMSFDVAEGVNLDYDVRCSIRSTRQQTVYDFWDDLNLFRSLMAFSQDREVKMGRGRLEKKPHGNSLRGEIDLEAEIIGPGSRPLDESDSVSPHDMLFTFSELRGQGPSFVKNWFLESPELRPIYDIYMATVRSKEVHPVNGFLNMIQGLEGLHKRKYGEEDDLKDQLEFFWAWVPSLMNQNCIEYRSRWAEKAKEQRHYYSHYYPEDEANVPPVDGYEMARLFQEAKLLFQASLMVHLGLDRAHVEGLLESARRFRS